MERPTVLLKMIVNGEPTILVKQWDGNNIVEHKELYWRRSLLWSDWYDCPTTRPTCSESFLDLVVNARCVICNPVGNGHIAPGAASVGKLPDGSPFAIIEGAFQHRGFRKG